MPSSLIMSLAKIPFTFLFGLCMHVLFTAPNPAMPKKVGQTITEDLVDPVILTKFIPRTAYCVHAAIEMMIILAALLPKSTVAESILTILLPHKDPNRIFLSPMGFLGTLLTMMGAIIRFQCYRTMGKHFTFEVTILKNHKLITSGPYAYVRHPSYTGSYIAFVGIVIWYTAQGSWLRESEVYKKPLGWLVMAPVMAHFLVVSVAMLQRVRKEDEMMKKVFGETWHKWAREVPDQLFPGIY